MQGQKRINQLDAVTELADADILHCQQGGVDKNVSAEEIARYAIEDSDVGVHVEALGADLTLASHPWMKSVYVVDTTSQQIDVSLPATGVARGAEAVFIHASGANPIVVTASAVATTIAVDDYAVFRFTDDVWMLESQYNKGTKLPKAIAGMDFERLIYGDDVRGSIALTDCNTPLKSGFYYATGSGGVINSPDSSKFWMILHIQQPTTGNQAEQIAIRNTNTTANHEIYKRSKSGGTWTAWQSMVGGTEFFTESASITDGTWYTRLSPYVSSTRTKRAATGAVYTGSAVIIVGNIFYSSATRVDIEGINASTGARVSLQCISGGSTTLTTQSRIAVL